MIEVLIINVQLKEKVENSVWSDPVFKGRIQVRFFGSDIGFFGKSQDADESELNCHSRVISSGIRNPDYLNGESRRAAWCPASGSPPTSSTAP